MILQFDFPLVKIQHINIWSKNAEISYHNFQISNTFLNNEKDEFDKPIPLKIEKAKSNANLSILIKSFQNPDPK